MQTGNGMKFEEHDIGIIGSSTTPFDGYMAEINVIVGPGL